VTPRDGTRTADYEYTLPPDRIAQQPSAQRDESRLLVVDRARGSFTHGRFRDLVDLIPGGDAIVLNTSRVIRARLLGSRSGGGKAEVFLLASHDDGSWDALIKPGSRVRDGARIRLGPNADVVVGRRTSGYAWRVYFESDVSQEELLESYGHVPLPPYVRRPDDAADAERYQTVYAREPGSVAAPTAGLHFTTAMLDALRARGVRRTDVMLHVGAGTFKPVEHDDPSAHVMHSESYTMPASTAEALNEVRASGHHVWAVGTTALRVLESVVDDAGRFAPRTGQTSLFIRPPAAVRGAERLITNFHLPRSTLLMLVAAFAGYDLTMRAYESAIVHGYRFYSYGDAMCVV
jgi:S-adenosylmethionine:tRNA ribosyltransferase-isomerase